MKGLTVLSIAAALVFSTLPANAACFGSGAFRSCYDNSGNNYTAQKFGNSTYTNGYNTNTGKTWSQNSQTFGNITIHNGTASNGNTWIATEQRVHGNMKSVFGTDSRGNSFNYLCGPHGCN